MAASSKRKSIAAALKGLNSEGWSAQDDEYHEDPVPDLCLAGFPIDSSSSTTSSGSFVNSSFVGPTRPPDVLLPLTDPDWQCGSLPRSNAVSDAKGLRERIMTALSPSGDSGVSESVSQMSLEEQEAQKAQWREELAKVEDDIVLMRETLHTKIQEAHALKQKLGITIWSELSGDVNQGIKSVYQSQVYQNVSEKFSDLHSAVTQAPIYQKTGAALKSTGERASDLFAGLTAKISVARDSAAFKSVEERVGTMVTSVKSKVGGSHSNSTHSFDEALKEAGAEKQTAAEDQTTAQ